MAWRADIAPLLTSTDRVNWKEQGNFDIRQTGPVSGNPTAGPDVFALFSAVTCVSEGASPVSGISRFSRRAGGAWLSNLYTTMATARGANGVALIFVVIVGGGAAITSSVA